MFIFIALLYYACGFEDVLKLKENYIFASFLLGTTILNSSIRERSNIIIYISL